MKNTCGRFERPVKRTCLVLGIVVLPLFSAMVSAQALPLDSLQRRFVHDRFGMFIHWGLYAVPGWAPSWPRGGGNIAFPPGPDVPVADYSAAAPAGCEGCAGR